MARTEELRRGHFEAVIGLMLGSLEKIFNESVEVEWGPRIARDGSPEIELAYELTYTTAGRPYCWLLECERQDGSKEAVERLIAAKRSRADARHLFLYHLDRGLAGELRDALEAEGIDHYSLKEFGIRLDEVNCALAEDSSLDKSVFRLELMKASREYPALRAVFSRIRVPR